MLESLRIGVRGRLAYNLSRQIAADTRLILPRLLIDATLLWEEQGFSRFDDSEISCTVRVFDCCDSIARRNDRSWAALIRIQYDATQLTAAIRQGRADPRRAPRPDMAIFIASRQVQVEAKRLKLRDGLPAAYVSNGLMRFASGYYEASLMAPGVMLGYVLEDEPSQIIDVINEIIKQEPTLGAAHVLANRKILADRVEHYESSHGGFGLLHQTIDIR